MGQREKSELERLLLASLLCTGGAGIDETLISSEDFSVQHYKAIFSAIGELHLEGISADANTVLVKLQHPKDGTASVLADLNGAVLSGSNLQYFAGELKAAVFEHKSREASRMAADKIKEGQDADVVLAELTATTGRLRSRYAEQQDTCKLATACKALLDRIEERKPAEGIIKTGIASIDDLCGGMAPGEYVVLAARPSVGKTTFAMNIAANAARAGIRTCFVSLEMKAPALASKLLAMVSGRNTKMALRNPAEIDIESAEDMLNSAGALFEVAEKVDLHDDTGSAMGPINAAIKASVKAGAKLIILDYLQLMECDGENRNQQVSAISRWFKSVVSTLNVPGIALCQLSRASEQEKRPPRMSDLRDSGSIEQDADVVWFLHQVSDEQIAVLQAKGRNVGVGARTLHFRKVSQTFHDIEGG